MHYNFMLGMDKADAMAADGNWLLPPGDPLVEATRRFRPMPHAFAGYAGPWIENCYFQHFLRRQESPETTARRYLPIFWTDLQVDHRERLEDLEAFLHTLDRSQPYYTVLQSSNGLGVRVPEGLDLKVFAAGCSVPGGTVIPLLKAPYAVSESREPKAIEVSFAGTVIPANDYACVRTRLVELVAATSGWITYCGPEWEAVVASSKFSLCPRGHGPTSFRLAESISLDSVPVVVWKDELLLPYPDLDWSTFAVVVEASDIPKLPGILRAADWAALHAGLQAVKERFTYEYVVRYIAGS